MISINLYMNIQFSCNRKSYLNVIPFASIAKNCNLHDWGKTNCSISSRIVTNCCVVHEWIYNSILALSALNYFTSGLSRLQLTAEKKTERLLTALSCIWLNNNWLQSTKIYHKAHSNQFDCYKQLVNVDFSWLQRNLLQHSSLHYIAFDWITLDCSTFYCSSLNYLKANCSKHDCYKQ